MEINQHAKAGQGHDDYDPELVKPTITGSDIDAALKFIENGGDGVPPMTAEDEKRLVRKIDMTIVPLMLSLPYIALQPTFSPHTSAVNYANIMGLQADTGINGNQFSQLALIFYVSYLAFEFPTGYLMQILPTAKYLGANVVCWGVMVACTAVARSWGTLVALRVLLGCFEAAVAPALILITAMWYKKSEQPLRVGVWYVGTGVGQMVGSVTSFGFQHYKGSVFKSWQIMFLVYGVLTVIVGLLVVFVMPDNPMVSRLSDTEKQWAIARLRENMTGIENKKFKKSQVVECLRDPQTWLLALAIMSSSIPNGFLSTYSSTVIKTFGFTSEVSALMGIPSGAFTAILTITCSLLAGKYNIRGFLAVGLLATSTLGSCLLRFLPAEGHVAGKMAGTYLTSCTVPSLALIYSFASANFSGHTKKITLNALLLICFCIGNVIGPLTFRDKDKPEYIPAKIAMVITNAFAGVCISVLVMYYKWENRRRDRIYANMEHVPNSEFFNLTDRENHEFRNLNLEFQPELVPDGNKRHRKSPPSSFVRTIFRPAENLSLRTQARQPVAKLAFSSLADTTGDEQPWRASQSSAKERKAPRHRDGKHKPRHAGARPSSRSDVSAFDMFNQIVNAKSMGWTGNSTGVQPNEAASGTRPSTEIDITFMLSTLVARKNDPVDQRLQTFEESIWPHLRNYDNHFPVPISQLLIEFINNACRDEIQYGRASSCLAIAQLAARVGITSPHIPNIMALKICHVFATSKNSSAHRNLLAQNLLALWMHVSQMQRLPEKERPLRLALPDKVEFSVGLRSTQKSNDGVLDDSSVTPEAFLNAVFPQFENGRARELMDGLLATLCFCSDPRFVTERVQREFAPLLELASIFFGEYSQSAELMLQEFPHHATLHAVLFPSEKSHELQAYIMNQWPIFVLFLQNQQVPWRQGSSAKEPRTSLAQIHKRLRKAYIERNKPGVRTIWAELYQRQANSAGLRSAIQSRPELMDFIIFIACALRLDYEYKTAVELMNGLQIPLTLKTYTGMMHGWRLCKDTRKIDALWDQLESANVRLDVPIWTERLAAYILKGKIGLCITALAKLQTEWDDAVKNDTVAESGAVQPSIEMVNACIKGILEIDPPAAKVLLSWAHNNGIRPDVSTHNIILRRAFSSGPDDVAWIMELMEKNGVEPNQATFVILIEEMLALTGADSPEAQVEAVNQVFADLARSKFALTGELYAKALHAVASLADASDEAVEAVLAHLRHQKVRINPYMVTILIERSLQRDPRSFAPIEALLHRYGMADISRGDQTLWERVIRAAALTGEARTALARFDELAAAGRPVTSLPCLNELLRALLAEDDTESARRVVDTVLHNKMAAQAQKGSTHGEDGGGDDEARFWKHHFWHVAKENQLLDEKNMPGGLHRMIEHY
ncbi:Major facilitator superfamily domain, general substrate transporter [Cordyceps fumosorosea ARSEF 2679]|uniref:Major facilitator superfamily domain, general substrate transporter n=1 Tax=Cordyceps fumosorosea (strain ARSEF 2679) TaxID=1081104 RepID=A0A168B972_CORFA|nr:Major facilitator superfamily domain, general substrate transporter [Cordyceps fumosorosea ARSEF 2679]OAA69795.1 Major facilitator superfamily domain, general substrate transporter [Cordyceps fumosorosea ARSEF 2679]